MALDMHDELFYGKTPELRIYACRSQDKEGTTYFYRVATLYVIGRQVRVTLAIAYGTDYTFTDGTPARRALMPARVPDKRGRRHIKWLVFVVIHLDWSVKKVAQCYRRRFGIESTYRQLDLLRARTTSRHPALRFFLLGVGFLLLNSWVMLRFLATRLIARGPARWDEDAFRLFRFIAFLRRAIKQAFGTTDSIPIYSW